MTVSLSDTTPNKTETGLDAYGNISPNGNGIYIFTRVTRWTTSSDGSRRVCTVDVSWADGTGTTHSVTMSTERIP
jgi:hypothetical protein